MEEGAKERWGVAWSEECLFPQMLQEPVAGNFTATEPKVAAGPARHAGCLGHEHTGSSLLTFSSDVSFHSTLTALSRGALKFFIHSKDVY